MKLESLQSTPLAAAAADRHHCRGLDEIISRLPSFFPGPFTRDGIQASPRREISGVDGGRTNGESSSAANGPGKKLGRREIISSGRRALSPHGDLVAVGKIGPK
jgi:hypothetical protein